MLFPITNTTVASTATNLWSLYSSTCVSQHPS